MDIFGHKRIKTDPALPEAPSLECAETTPEAKNDHAGRQHRITSGRLFFWMGITSVLLMVLLFLSAKITEAGYFADEGSAASEDPAKISIFSEDRNEALPLESAPPLMPEGGAQYDRSSRMLVEALYINSEVKGYLTVEGTSVYVPVLQAGDNEYYLENSIGKAPSKQGSVFFDARNTDISDDDILVIYGNAENGGSFSELLKFADIEFYEQHGFITLDRRFWTDGVTVWKIVAAYFAEENEDPLYQENESGKRMLNLCVKSDEGDFIIRAEPAD
jgi:SrtB family sortase